MRDEKRKKLKDTTSNTRSFLATSMPASQAEFSRLCWCGVVKDSPTNTAIVKSELTLTRPSRAVTWTLVVEEEA